MFGRISSKTGNAEKKGKRMTRVINIHANRARGYVYIGRGSAFGNPYRMGKDGDRKTVIEKFRKHFQKRLHNERFKKAVEDLRGKTLGCFCKPEACHGDVIVEYLEGK
jgi:hypothetical protein